MFEYAIEVILKDLEKEKNYLKQEFIKIEEVENKITEISDFENLKHDLKTNKRYFSFSIVEFILLAFLILFSHANGLFFIFTLIPMLRAVSFGKDIFDLRNTLNKDYEEYVILSQNHLEDLKKSLNKQREGIIDNSIGVCDSLLSKIELLKDYDKLKSYNELLSNRHSNLFVLSKAKNKEDYLKLLALQKENLKILDDYLQESVDYSDIHFDASIGENINYTENSKKLIKKM